MPQLATTLLASNLGRDGLCWRWGRQRRARVWRKDEEKCEAVVVVIIETITTIMMIVVIIKQ